MNDRTVNFLISTAIFCVVFLFLDWILAVFLPSFDGISKAFVLGAATAIVSPRYERYEMMGEKKSRIKWIFQQ